MGLPMGWIISPLRLLKSYMPEQCNLFHLHYLNTNPKNLYLAHLLLLYQKNHHPEQR